MFEFTVCRSAEQGRCPTKTFTRQPDGTLRKQDYPFISWWSFELFAAGSIDECAAKLRAMTFDPATMLIHGEALDWEYKYQRRLWANPAEATVKTAPRTSIAIDVDKQVVPPCAGSSFGEQAKWLRDNRLPAEFAGVAMIVMPSASTSLGDPSIFNGRMFVALTEAHDLKAIKNWARGCKIETGLKIDPSIYEPGQPIYIARPLFLGMADPIPAAELVTVIPGDHDRVALEICHYDKPLRAAEQKAERIAYACGGDWRQLLERSVGVEPLHEFNKPLTTAIGLAARSGASLAEVRDAVAEVLADPDRDAGTARLFAYSAAWVKRAFDSFLSRDARAVVAINELKKKLFG